MGGLPSRFANASTKRSLRHDSTLTMLPGAPTRSQHEALCNRSRRLWTKWLPSLLSAPLAVARWAAWQILQSRPLRLHHGRWPGNLSLTPLKSSPDSVILRCLRFLFDCALSEPSFDEDRTLTAQRVRISTGRPRRAPVALPHCTSRYSLVQALVGKSHDSPRMPTPGTKV